MKISLCEVVIGEIYTRDELFEASDWFLQDDDIGFCSVLEEFCVRFERDDIEKDKFVVKEIWTKD